MTAVAPYVVRATPPALELAGVGCAPRATGLPRADVADGLVRPLGRHETIAAPERP